MESGSAEARHLTGRSMLGVCWAFAGHTLYMLSIRLMEAMHVLSFLSLDASYTIGIHLVYQGVCEEKDFGQEFEHM